MKNKKITILAASVISAIGLLLSCSLEPYGEGFGKNSTGGDTSNIVQNLENEHDNGNDNGGHCKKPTAPSGVSASAQSSSSIKISWYSVSGASYYNVYRSTSSNGTYSYVGNTYSTSYTNTGLSSSTTYYYKVTAENSCGESAYSSSDYATTSSSIGYTAPSTPTGLSAQGVSTDTILITWNSVSNATGYYLYYSSSSTGTYTKAGPYYGTSLRLTGLTAGSTRYFKISAYNNYGESSLSSYVSGTTKISSGCNAPPAAPKNVVCTANWWNEIEITWSSVSGATYYEVYNSKSPNGTYEYVGSTTSTSYKEGWLDGSTTYYYRIKAVNGCGSSSFSEYGYAKTGLFG